MRIQECVREKERDRGGREIQGGKEKDRMRDSGGTERETERGRKTGFERFKDMSGRKRETER